MAKIQSIKEILSVGSEVGIDIKNSIEMITLRCEVLSIENRNTIYISKPIMNDIETRLMINKSYNFFTKDDLGMEILFKGNVVNFYTDENKIYYKVVTKNNVKIKLPRRHNRFYFKENILVNVFLQRADNEYTLYKGVMKNISIGGLAVDLDCDIKNEINAKLFFSLGGENFKFNSKIAHKNVQDKKTKVGFKFINTDINDEGRLMMILNAMQESYLR